MTRCSGRRIPGGIEWDCRSAHVCDAHRLAVVAYFKQVGKSSRSVARHGDDPQRSVADGNRHSVIAGDVAFGFPAHVRLRFVDRVPIFRAVYKVHRRDSVLQHFGAAIMVAVSVRKDYVFDLVGIQSKLLQTAEDLVLGGVVEQRLDDDDALVSDQRPSAVDLCADKVEIVGDFCRFRVPGLPCRSCPVSNRRAGSTGGRWNAKPKKSPRPVGPRGYLGSAYVTVQGAGRRLAGSDSANRKQQEADSVGISVIFMRYSVSCESVSILYQSTGINTR